MSQQLSLETLESWLWESANILRGSIGAIVLLVYRRERRHRF